MISRRVLLGTALAGAAVPAARFAHAGDDDPAVATVSSFYDVLTATMRDGHALGFDGRAARLAPAIRRSFNLPLMTRLMVGPQWTGLPPAVQQQLVRAFSDFSIATYANRFDDYSGERFQVDPKPSPVNGGAIVHTKLVRSDGAPVQIDYLMRDDDGAWQIVDVYLSGTVSELATRRSEFASVMRRGGATALVDLLQRRTAQLKG